MDYSVLSSVVDELAAALPGSRVDKVVPAGDDSAVLILRRKGKALVLLLAAERSLPRIHLLSRKPAMSASPALFHLLLKKYLVGSMVAGIRIVNQDRVIELRCSRLNEDVLLILELIGASANMVLTDGARKIISVLRSVPPGDRGERALVPGIVYEPPPGRQHAASGKTVSQKSDHAGSQGMPAVFSLNRAAETMFEQVTAEKREERLRQSLETTIRKARSRVTRRIEAVQEDLKAAERGDEHRRSGELILAHLSLLERGQEEAELADQAGVLSRVMLDPARTPTENAERYFRKYKKAKAGFAVLRERLEEARTEKALLDKVHNDLEAAVDLDSLEAVRNTLLRLGLLLPESSKAVRAVRAAPPYRAVLYKGWEIIIGRSAAGNDYVTMHLAKPDDLWLHAEGMPGSHVLVRNPRKSDIPPAVVKKAASLAAYYSKGKGSTKVPVAYTAAKHVKKPKGTAPGTVLLRERKSIMASPESADGGQTNVP